MNTVRGGVWKKGFCEERHVVPTRKTSLDRGRKAARRGIFFFGGENSPPKIRTSTRSAQLGVVLTHFREELTLEDGAKGGG